MRALAGQFALEGLDLGFEELLDIHVLGGSRRQLEADGFGHKDGRLLLEHPPDCSLKLLNHLIILVVEELKNKSVHCLIGGLHCNPQVRFQDNVEELGVGYVPLLDLI